MASFSRAVDSVDREDVCFDGPIMLERPKIGLFAAVPVRCLLGETGSGILDGVGGGLWAKAGVDDDDDDESVVDDEGTGLAFIKEASDVCLSVAASG